MLTGKRQAVDSVFVKANASMSSVKDILEDGKMFIDQLKADQAADTDDHLIKKSEERKPQKRSNANRISTIDPDARMSVKPGKVTKLNYLSQLSVDTSASYYKHGAFHADKKDNQCLDKVCANLGDHGLEVKEVIADANYSSSTVL
jgi:hypothetical protein